MVVVARPELENSNFSLPPQLHDEFRKLGDAYGENNKMRWAVAAAAVVRLVEMTDEDREELIGELLKARPFPERMDRLVEAAKGRAQGEVKQKALVTKTGVGTAGKKTAAEGTEAQTAKH